MLSPPHPPHARTQGLASFRKRFKWAFDLEGAVVAFGGGFGGWWFAFCWGSQSYCCCKVVFRPFMNWLVDRQTRSVFKVLSVRTRRDARDAGTDLLPPPEHPGSIWAPGWGRGDTATPPPPAYGGCNAIKTTRSQIDGKLSQSVQKCWDRGTAPPPAPSSALSPQSAPKDK